MARWIIGALAAILPMLTVPCALAQGPPVEEREGINVNIFVNHGAAYREGTWAPVDVIVRNDQEDVSGWVEVQLISPAGTVKSPVYRVPAESPKQSLKRFRLYCKMEDTAKIEVNLYQGPRAVLDFPAWIAVTPIRPEDFLCLVLDARPENYGFLSTTLYREERGIRFYREALMEDQLGLLADHLSCFEPFDLIVLGDIDPSLISESHRGLLTDYVRRGGLLAVFTGDHAEKYRGTWVEPLLGAGIGTEALVREEDLAAQAFANSPALQAGVKPGREGTVAGLSPTLEGVQRMGGGMTLATRRMLGQGIVAGIAIDSESTLLQDCTGFHALWRDLIAQRRSAADLNFNNVVQSALPNVPRLAGVELFPISSIIIYLLLYFLIAIVANWLFWNYFKRREWAWVCLVFFSIGFTAYAMFYGTQGRANRTELEQFDLLRLPQGDSTAEVISYVGVLSEGSDHYAGQFLRDDILVEDVSLLDNRALMRAQMGMQTQYAYRGGPPMASGPGMGMYPGIGSQPFQYVQDTPPTFANLYIGASDLRFVRTISFLPLDGGFEGTLSGDENGPSGELTNKTGLRLAGAALYFNGRFYPVRVEGDTLKIAGDPRAVASFPPGSFAGMPGFLDPGQMNAGGRTNNSANFGRLITQSLLADMNGRLALLPPSLLAEVAGPPLDVLNLEAAASRNLSARYLLAEIPFSKGEGKPGMRTRIPVRSFGRNLPDDIEAITDDDALRSNIIIGTGGEPVALEAYVPGWLLPEGRWKVVLDVYATNDEEILQGRGMYFPNERRQTGEERASAPPLVLRREGADDVVQKPDAREVVQIAGFPFSKQSFVLAESGIPADFARGIQVDVLREVLSPGNGVTCYLAGAYAEKVETPTEGETVKWQ